MTEIVVFDLGGVLCDFRPERRLAALAAATGLAASRIEGAIWGSGLDERAEIGELSSAETVAAVLEALEHRIDEAELLHAWSLAFEPNRAVLDVAQRVAARRYVFTNNGPLVAGALGSEITSAFDRLICSHELRTCKPEVVAFQRLAAELDSEPSTITLIDDDDENCQGAEAAGFRVVPFIDAGALESELRRVGLMAV